MTEVFRSNFPLTRCLLVILMAVGALLPAACGKRKAPQPPTERVRQRVELKAAQKGSKVLLSWKLPASNAPSASLLNLERADIYRLAVPATDNNPIDEEEFASESTLISSVKISKEDLGKDLAFTDRLSLIGQPVTLHYAVRLVNNSGQKAPFSNFVTVRPAAKVALAPESVVAEATQDAVSVSWRKPGANIDGSQPANVLGFNIYRSESGAKAFRLVSRTPVTDDVFQDADFEFGKEYSYYVRTVSLGADGNPVESDDSERVTLTPKDVFAPSAPEAVTIAASPRTISIFFSSNPEKDVVGYRVYRSTDAAVPEVEWTLVTKKLLETTTFQDDAVESGKTYYYFIVAVDRFGNSSPHSVVVNETVPQ